MHRSTRDHLEALLTGRKGQAAFQREDRTSFSIASGHIAECRECSSEVEVMREQAAWVQQLRSPEEVEPSPGFYARVLQQIERHARHSIWYGLVYSPVGKRLAYASLSLALLLGLYVMTAEHLDQQQFARSPGAQHVNHEVSGASTQAEQRDAVLVNLVSVESVQK